MGTHWVARVGTARVDFASKVNTRRAVCFVLTASGHLLTCHDDGLIEEAAAFDAMPLLQIRQIHAGTKAAVTLYRLITQASFPKLVIDFHQRIVVVFAVRSDACRTSGARSNSISM